jgi:glycosyltransferase involved in cell wall biosynthesis
MTAIEQQATIEVADWNKLPASPLVSIYMLAYRHERFIADAISGVLAQQCDFPIELIIGEDCSPDSTRDIVLDFQRRHPELIRVLTSEHNVGGYDNARRCLLATRGKYVAICEGDDFWHHPKKLQMQVDLMEANPSMTVCHTDYDRLTKFRRRRSMHKQQPSRWLAKGDAYIPLLHEWSVTTATSMYRRDVLMSFVGSIYDNPAWPFGDWNKLLFASLMGPFGYLDVSTAAFRKRLGSASNSGADSRLRMTLCHLECIKLFLSTHPVDDATASRALSKTYRKMYQRAYQAGNVDKMDEARASLLEYGSSMPSWLHGLRKLAIRLRLPFLIQSMARTMITRHLSGM